MLLAEAFEWQGTGAILSNPVGPATESYQFHFDDCPSPTPSFPFSVTRGDLPGIELDFEKTMLTFSKSKHSEPKFRSLLKTFGISFTSLAYQLNPLKDFAKGFSFIDSEGSPIDQNYFSQDKIMKISEVKGARKIKVWVEPIDPSDSIENKQVRIEMGSVEGVYELFAVSLKNWSRKASGRKRNGTA